MKASMFASVAALLLMGSAVPLEGQSPGSVWVEPRVGWTASAGDLGRTDILGGIGFTRFDDVDGSASVGLGVGVTLTETVSIRAFLDRGLDANASGEWSCAPFVACPSVIMLVEGEVSRWSGGVDAIVDPGIALGPVSPHVFAGFGLRRQELTWGDPISTDIGLPAHDFEDTEPVLRLGLGVEHAFGSGAFVGSFEATGGPFGAPGVQVVEGSVPDGRETRVDLAFLGGFRWYLN